MTLKISEETEAFAQGWEARVEKKKRKAPDSMSAASTKAWLTGWDAADDKLAGEKK